MKQKFNIITSTCVPLPLENIDTDQIIPARFLKATTREEKFFGDNLFRDWRYRPDGTLNKDFVLNDSSYSGCVLVAGKNFGSGSSREHAAWAIAGYGFRAVISSSFADIHRNNELNNFVLPVEVSEAFLAELFESIHENPQTQVVIDLPNQTVTNSATSRSEHFPINGYKKYCLMNGLDDIDFLVESLKTHTLPDAPHEPAQPEHSTSSFIWRAKGESSPIEIMDTTLRDGEQTSGVSFMPHEKLMICRALLEDLRVDRVEVASARVSEGEMEAVQRITSWAASKDMLDRVEVLGFVDDGKSLDWIERAGARTINLLCKGSRRHCTEQLGKTPEQHFADIRRNVEMAAARGINVNLYLEDWSGGMKQQGDNYVFQLIDSLVNLPVARIMLPDTLGILNPLETLDYMRQMVARYPNVHFDFHAHNDYDLAVSNVLGAVFGGARGLHTAINGLGERAGNAPLASVQAILKDHFNAQTNINEEQLNRVAHMVESYSGIAIPPNKPITGSAVFTQVAGVHADGDKKNGLYQNALRPERFGRRREYALGKSSGKANIRMNLEELGLDLSEEDMKKVTDRIIELGDKKELVTQEDLPYIIRDVLKHSEEEERVRLLSYMVSTAYGLRPMAQVRLQIDDKIYEESAQGDGQYDAFVRAVRHIYRERLGREFPWLSNYTVTIPPGGRTDALVQTIIEWTFRERTIRTHALDADQTEAAIKATIKLLNIIEPMY